MPQINIPLGDVKSILSSKTFWFNIGSFLTSVGGFIPPKYGVWINLVGNIVLRAVSDQPVSVPGLGVMAPSTPPEV